MRRDGNLPKPEVPPGASAAEKTAMLAVAASHPAWMVERWLQRYGEADTIKLLVANNRYLAYLHACIQDGSCVRWPFDSSNTMLCTLPGCIMSLSARMHIHWKVDMPSGLHCNAGVHSCRSFWAKCLCMCADALSTSPLAGFSR